MIENGDLINWIQNFCRDSGSHMRQEDVDANFERYVTELQEHCRIESVSADADGLWDCARYLEGRLGALGFTAQIHDVGGGLNAPVVITERQCHHQARQGRAVRLHTVQKRKAELAFKHTAQRASVHRVEFSAFRKAA